MDVPENTFERVVQIIENARTNAYRKVNEELIIMYQKVGQFLSEKSKEASYGDAYIDTLASFIEQRFPGIKGFNRRGLYRMRQFYETYAGDQKVSPLVTQLSWTNHLIILARTKSVEEREFYLRLTNATANDNSSVRLTVAITKDTCCLKKNYCRKHCILKKIRSLIRM